MANTTVDRGSEEAVAIEAALRVRARKESRLRSFDPRLGATREEAEARVDAIRADLGEYGTYVHGHQPARHHRLWIDLIQALINDTLTETAIELGLLPESERGTYRNKLLLLAPPASAKSAWCSIALPTWYLGRHPSHNVLFFTSSDPAAVGFANTIKILLEQSNEHKQIFPENGARPHKARGWSGDGLYLKDTPMSGQSPAYRAVGWGASVMGNRADLMIIDDPMNQEDAESSVEQAKAKRYFDMTLGPRLKPDQGALVAIMTRWAEGDLASHFIQRAEEAGDFLIVSLPMIAEPTPEAPDPLGREPGEVLWPEQFSARFVDQMRRGMLEAHWNAVYQCSAAQIAGDVFKDERWIKPLPPDFRTPGPDGSSLRDRLRIFQGVDVAFSERDSACYTVILTLGQDVATNDLFILDVFRERMGELATENALVDQIVAWHPAALGIEDSAFRHAITIKIVQAVMRRVHANIQIVNPRGIMRGASDKVARARVPARVAQLGQLYADKTASWWRPLIAELLAFPRGANQDQVDALSLAVYMPSTLVIRSHKPKPVTFNPD